MSKGHPFGLEQHRPYTLRVNPPREVCYGCAHDWPCPVGAVRAERDALRARVAALEEKNSRVRAACSLVTDGLEAANARVVALEGALDAEIARLQRSVERCCNTRRGRFACYGHGCSEIWDILVRLQAARQAAG